MIAVNEDDGPLVGLYLLAGDDVYGQEEEEEEEEEDFVPMNKSEHVGAAFGALLGRVAVGMEYALGVWLALRLLGKPW